MKTLLVFLCLVPAILLAQKQDASKQIRELKNTMLLVELKDAGNASEALKSQGETEKARKLEASVNRQNQEIAGAFREYFNFCPVYFYYDLSKDEISRMHFMNVLMDADLKPVKAISRPVPMFYVARFGYLDSGPEGSRSGGHVKALVIRDHKFVQLKEPFPYYVKASSLEGHYGKKVKKLNKQLNEFYQSQAVGH